VLGISDFLFIFEVSLRDKGNKFKSKKFKMTKNSEYKRVAHITYTDNYGNKGNRAWLIKETINGKPNGDPYGHKVAKREHFIRLHEIVLDYLGKGWEIEIKNQ